MDYSLATTSQAIEATCVLNLQLKSNGYGCDTIDSFQDIVAEFSYIFTRYPDFNITEAISYWENNQNDEGRLITL